MAPKRKLLKRLSDAQAEARAETKHLSDRTKRRRLQEVRQNEYHVPMQRRSAQYALGKWPGYHFALMGLTILFRCLFSAKPALRQNRFEECRLYMGTKRIEQSYLFRQFLDSPEGCAFGVQEIAAITKAMCNMHCHFPTAEGDHLHKITAPIVAEQDSVEGQVRAVSFFLEFSWISHLNDLDLFKK